MSARLGSEMRRALTARNVSRDRLAAMVGLSVSAIHDIARGGQMPLPATIEAIAEALDWPMLVPIVTEARTRSCEVCGSPFTDGGRSNTRRTCGVRCQRTRHQRMVRGASVTAQYAQNRMLRNRLALYQERVDAMCRACVLGSGLCPDATCELREVSPIPLPERRRVA